MLKELYTKDLSGFIPIKYRKKNIGWLNKCNLNLSEKFRTFDSHIELCHVVNYSLKKSKNQIIEYCPIFYCESLDPQKTFNHKKKFCEKKIFKINRKHLSQFGLPVYGVHCNVWSKLKNSTIFHFAIRSKKLKKFPGFYDNLIAGGQPVGLSIEENLQKESYEEAGLNIKQISQAKKSSTVHYMHNDRKKFNSSVIFIYQLEKTDDMIFKNQDGEVDEFIQIEANEIYKIIEKKILKPNCIIPIIDFLIMKEDDSIPKNAIFEIKKLMNFYK